MNQVYKIQYQIIMKKTKLDKPQPHSITLSSKRASLNQEQLFVPYKIDWKNSPLQNVQNNSSKAFFQNMKAQLSNIKNDFEKLIKKEGSIQNSEKDEEFKSISKPKCQSAYKKETKKISFDRFPENEKLQIVKNNKEQSDHYFKILNLEKNLPCTSTLDYKNHSSKTVNMKDNLIKEFKNASTPFDRVEINKNDRVQSSRGERVPVENKTEEKDKEIFYLKQSINSLQIQLKDTKQERDFTKNEAQKLFSQKNILISKMTELSNQLAHKVDIVIQQDGKIKKLNEDLANIRQQIEQKPNLEQQFCNQRNFYQERMNQLIFHNQNLANINMELGGENQMLKQNLVNLQRYIEQLKRHQSNLDIDFKRKQEYMQRQIQQYQKREDMFSKQIEKLTSQLNKAIQNTQTSSCTTISSSNFTASQEIQQLKNQITHLTNQVNIEKDIHQALSKRYEQQIASLRIEQMSHQFQTKINRLVDENCKLKSKINFCESSLQSISQQNQSYLMQINLYQERQRNQSSKRQLSCSQWQELTQKIERLKQQNKRLSDELQYKTLKQESEQNIELPNSNCDALIKMANMQLFQNQKLKQTIRQLSTSLKLSQQKIESLQLLQSKLTESANLKENPGSLARITEKHELIYQQLQLKNNQVRNIKDLVFKVLIEKTNKLQDEEQMDYYLRQIQNRRQLF